MKMKIISTITVLILTIFLIGCDADTLTSALEGFANNDSCTPSQECIVGTWKRESLEVYSNSYCSGSASSSNTDESYIEITATEFGLYDLDTCQAALSLYVFNENGGNGVISQGGINRNIKSITESELVFEIAASGECYSYTYSKELTDDWCEQ